METVGFRIGKIRVKVHAPLSWRTAYVTYVMADK